MRRLRIVAALVFAAAAAGCSRYDEYPYPPPYYQPYYQQACPPRYQQPGTYAQPAVSPCAPAAVGPPAAR